MAVAPVGGWLAVGGRGGWEPWLLALAIGTWVGGFDVLYACQDLEFDRAHGLRSIPVRFGVPASLAISRAMHVDRRRLPRWRSALVDAARRDLPRRRRRASRCCSSTSSRWSRRRSVAGEARVRPERLRRHPVSARAGGVASMSADARRRRSRSRSPARAARSTRRGRWRRCSSAACHVELVVSDYGRRLLRDELGDAGVDRRLMPYLVGEVRRAASTPARSTVHSNRDLGATIASGSHGCQRHGDRAVLDEDAGRRRARPVAQPGRARRRRDAEGAAPRWSSCRARRR